MSTLRAKNDPSLQPLRVSADFSREFPDGEASATEVVLNLTIAGVMAVNRVEELLAQYGLVLKAFNVLAVVAGATEPLTPTAVAERVLAVKTTVTSVLDALLWLLRQQRKGRLSPGESGTRASFLLTDDLRVSYAGYATQD